MRIFRGESSKARLQPLGRRWWQRCARDCRGKLQYRTLAEGTKAADETLVTRTAELSRVLAEGTRITTESLAGRTAEITRVLAEGQVSLVEDGTQAERRAVAARRLLEESDSERQRPSPAAFEHDYAARELFAGRDALAVELDPQLHGFTQIGRS